MTRRNPFRSLLAALLLTGTLCLQPAPAATAGGSSGLVSSALLGAGAGLCTLVYTPLKIGYAGSGLAVSGLVYLWSVGDSARAGRLVRFVLGGDYVITPDHLKGERPVHFTGRR